MIEVLRVDDRLLHGQVAVSWTRHYKVDVILVPLTSAQGN